MNTITQGDCLEILRGMPDNSVDLVFTSPPYEDARTYGIGFKLRGEDWVKWCFERFMECYRVCRGMVAWVVEGKTRKFRYSCTPFLLKADLHRAGVGFRHPQAFHRVGIPGSGGPDGLRNDWEPILCATKGKLPWSDNTAMGRACVFAPGGAPSHRKANGTRVGKMARAIATNGAEPKVAAAIAGGLPRGAKLHTKHNGKEKRVQCYTPPAIANPGNVIHCVVGGGRMGSQLCHENEAPFPEALAEFFIRSFCPPGGVVLDPFCGSGTTLAVAERFGRQWIGIDVRKEQVALSERRVAEVKQCNDS